MKVEQSISFIATGDRGGKQLIPMKYRNFLQNNGFYKYYPSGAENYVFVRVIDNIVENVSEDKIKDFTLRYLENLQDIPAYNYYALETKLWTDKFLSLLEIFQENFARDTEEHATLYYNNCVVKVTKKGVEILPYKSITNHIWRNQIIDRNFKVTEFGKSEYKQFINNIAGNTPTKVESMESTIGYLLHAYKPASECPAVILNDETISDDPNGGTGKGICIKALSYMRRNVTIDGKTFSFKSNFLYQRVSADTQIMTYDDVPKRFEFEKLFSVITEGLTVEKKNKDQIHIPFVDSPKVVITTNYAISGTGNSHDRRKWELEFTAFYHKGFTPRQEFGHDLFIHWTDKEWLLFDNYMISCITLYLSRGLIKSEFKNLRIRTLESSTSFEFREWAINEDRMHDFHFETGTVYLGTDLMQSFQTLYPDYDRKGKYQLSHKLFYKWLDVFAEYKFGSKFIANRSQNGKTVQCPKPIDPQKKLAI